MNRAPAAAANFALWKKILLGLILGLAAMCLISVPLLRYGVVSGQEFSPGRFQRRSYHYWEIPLIHVQVTPLKKQDETNDLERRLIAKKLIRRANESQPRWDLVRLRRAEFETPPGNALILCRYLDQKDHEGNLIWLEWSKQHPQLAKVFWPSVAEAARRDLYFLIPDLFHVAQNSTEAGELKRRLAERLARQYEQLAKVEQELGRASRAADWYSAALKYDPQSPIAIEGKSKALRQAQSDQAQKGQPQSNTAP